MTEDKIQKHFMEEFPTEPPVSEPERQYYFIQRAREDLKKMSEALPLSAVR